MTSNLQELREIKELVKGMTKSGAIYNKDGKVVGFIDFKKPDGENEGFDCPVKEPENIREKLKRISKPNLIKGSTND